MITQSNADSPKPSSLIDGGAAIRSAIYAVAAKLGPQSRDFTHPREARLIRALLQRPHMREELDRIAGVSNGPDLVMNVKNTIGLKIDCQRMSFIDRDGRRCMPGMYALEPQSREPALRWLAGSDADRECPAGDCSA